ncbi:hypothetical protein LVJ94_26645 [Pendulispora rubella]|uniref:Uncharacterized protein n=1 Tax=Pendulispora rubella TaxID=2741070 RepID=A0ABZ2KQZ5_9BACT
MEYFKKDLLIVADDGHVYHVPASLYQDPARRLPHDKQEVLKKTMLANGTVVAALNPAAPLAPLGACFLLNLPSLIQRD